MRKSEGQGKVWLPQGNTLRRWVTRSVESLSRTPGGIVLSEEAPCVLTLAITAAQLMGISSKSKLHSELCISVIRQSQAVLRQCMRHLWR